MDIAKRFLSYVAYETTSDEDSSTTPSTRGQLPLAAHLCRELSDMGIEDARVDMYGYVYGTLPPNREGMATVGLIAHMDTAQDMPAKDVRTRTLLYEGGDILLDGGDRIPADGLDYYFGHELIVTDGTTLLGGDDKAGIAEIMTALEMLITENRPHGRVLVCFTPDEEIGRGTDHFDLASFPADYAYTMDGGRLGELEYENFNAARAVVRVMGKSFHPGSAKGRMKNAARILTELSGLLPPTALPELTEGYEGFFHLVSMSGTVASAEAVYLIRDHDDAEFAGKKRIMADAVAALNARYGEGTVLLDVSDTYYNMRSVIDKAPHTVERARAAMLALGIRPIESPIRGGTDGALLSHRGLPCPNLGTGSENHHSGQEFASIDDMRRAARLIVRIIENAVAVPEHEPSSTDR